MATKKYRPQVTMLEIEKLITSLTYTLEIMRENDTITLQNVAAPTESHIQYLEFKKLLDKLALFKYKSEIGINAPAYTIKGHSKEQNVKVPKVPKVPHVPLDKQVVEDNPLTGSRDIAQDIDASDMSPEEKLYNKYVMNKELTDKEKVLAIEYKMREDSESVTEEEQEFYKSNFHIILMGL